jgi:hypothetical protein
VAAVSLVGTVVGILCPPAGVVVAVGLAVYYGAKMIIGWFSVKDRDWVLEPPGTPQELFESGADIKWEARKVNGQDIAAVIPPTGGKETAVVMTLLLDSKWTQYNRNRQPVRYLIPKGLNFVQAAPVTPEGLGLGFWQAGKQVARGLCLGHGQHPGDAIACASQSPVWIMAGHPAVMKILYAYRRTPPCGQSKCTATSKSSTLKVLSEGTGKVMLRLPYSVAYG